MVILVIASSSIAQVLPPGTPFPMDGATDVPLDVTLRWTQFGPVDSTEIFFGGGADPLSLSAAPAGVTSFMPSIATRSLYPLGTYYWRLVSRRGAVTASTPVYSFTMAGPVGMRFVPLAVPRCRYPRRPRGVRQTSLVGGRGADIHLHAASRLRHRRLRARLFVERYRCIKRASGVFGDLAGEHDPAACFHVEFPRRPRQSQRRNRNGRCRRELHQRVRHQRHGSGHRYQRQFHSADF